MAREKQAEELEVAKGRRAEASSDSAIQEPREALEIRERSGNMLQGLRQNRGGGATWARAARCNRCGC